MHSHAMEPRPSRLPRLQDALATLAAPRRFDLVLLMLAGEDRSVSQLAAEVGLSQSCTTRHLQALARAGLVKGVRDGKRVVFRIAPRDEPAREVLASLSRGPSPGPAKLRVAAPRASSDTSRRARRERAHARRPAASPIPRAVLGAAIPIDSAAELEPLIVDSTAEPESGIT